MTAAEQREAFLDVNEARKRWKFRRFMAFGSVGWMLILISYLTVFGISTNVVQETLAQALPLATIGIILTYIGGAVVDDVSKLNALKGS